MYGLYAPGATDPYDVGQTNNPDRRETEHKDRGRLAPDGELKVFPGSANVTYAEARGHEQAYIEHHGTKTGSPGNVINSFRKGRSDQRGAAFETEYDTKKKTL